MARERESASHSYLLKFGHPPCDTNTRTLMCLFLVDHIYAYSTKYEKKTNTLSVFLHCTNKLFPVDGFYG